MRPHKPFVVLAVLAAVTVPAGAGARTTDGPPALQRPRQNRLSPPAASAERTIELDYAQRIRMVRDAIAALELRIAENGRQVDALKAQATATDVIAAALQELLPRLVGTAGSGGTGGMLQPEAAFGSQLGGELSKAGFDVSKDDLRTLADTVLGTGPDGVAAGLYLVVAIGRARAAAHLPARDRRRPSIDELLAAVTPAGRGRYERGRSTVLDVTETLLSASTYPTLTSADLASIVRRGGKDASTRLGSRFSAEAQQQHATIGKALAAKKKERTDLVSQVKALQKEIQRLEMEKARKLAEARKARLSSPRQALELQPSRRGRRPRPSGPTARPCAGPTPSRSS